MKLEIAGDIQLDQQELFNDANVKDTELKHVVVFFCTMCGNYKTFLEIANMIEVQAPNV